MRSSPIDLKKYNQNSYLGDTNYVPQNEGDVAYVPSAAGGNLHSSMQTIPTFHNFDVRWPDTIVVDK